MKGLLEESKQFVTVQTTPSNAMCLSCLSVCLSASVGQDCLVLRAGDLGPCPWAIPWVGHACPTLQGLCGVWYSVVKIIKGKVLWEGRM